MTYTHLGILAVLAAVLLDLFVTRTRLVRTGAFWTAYAIIVPFQLITNGVFTGARIVRYDGSAIIGSTTPETGRPPFLGDGRIAYAPVEDLLFGFALVLTSLALWTWLGRRGLQPGPRSGPPRWWWRGGPFGISGTTDRAVGASGGSDAAPTPGSPAGGDRANPRLAGDGEPSA